ncbi:hypothetical protein NL676_024513 [Syzygium grande]|nr:hypothetical protein NL676_024513 [Syzygium grande]
MPLSNLGFSNSSLFPLFWVAPEFPCRGVKKEEGNKKREKKNSLRPPFYLLPPRAFSSGLLGSFGAWCKDLGLLIQGRKQKLDLNILLPMID